jgi:hypothetical protein
MKRIGVMFLLVGMFLLAAIPALHAQTPPTQPSGEPFTITGNFAASTNNTIKNGVESTFEYTVHGRWSVRIDEIGLNNPSGTMLNLAEGQWKVPAKAIFGKNSPSSFSNILIGLHAGLGAVKNPAGAMSFAAGAGLSVDYQVGSFFFIRVANVTDGYSRGYQPNNQVFGNYNNVNVGMGVGFNF